MNIKPIRNDQDLKMAFHPLESVFQSEKGTTESDEIEGLVTLIEVSENMRYPISPPHPIEAIKFRIEQQGLTASGLEVFIGSSGRVSEILNKKLLFSLRMVKRLHAGLNIPYESLLADIDLSERNVWT